MPGKGDCTQCGKQLMIADTNGRFNSIKPDTRQADLILESGTKFKYIICEACSQAPDLDKAYLALPHKYKEMCGKPVKVENIQRRRF